MKKLDIEVYNKGVFIREAKDRFYRECPDGSVGIVFKKKIYPVYDNNKIDLTSNNYEKEKCPIIYYQKSKLHKTKDTEIPFEWHLETNKFGHYIVFNGETQFFESILNLLDNYNISWLRADESIRESDNGIMYDWFIRLESKDEREIVQNQIYNVFNEFEPQTQIPNPELEQLIQNLKHEIDGLKTQNKADKGEIKELALKLKSSEKINEIQYKELSLLKDERQTDEIDSQTTQDLIKEVEDLAQEEMEKNEELEEYIDHLKNKIDKLSSQNGKKSNVRYKKIKIITDLFTAMYPSIKFSEKCFAIISDYFTSYSALSHQLNLMIYDQKNFKKRKLKKTDGWWEADAHISTGIDDTGRYYFKPLANSKSYKYEINIRMKKTQKNDIDAIINHTN